MVNLEEEELALRTADELLAQDDAQQQQKQFHHRRGSSTGHLPTHALATPPRDLVASLTALVVASAIATHQLPRAAQHSHALLLAFPFLHFASLGLVALALGFWRPHGTFGKEARRGIELGKGGERANRTFMALAGVTSAVSFTLRLWTSRRNDTRLCEAVDLFVLPAILLILPYLTPRLPLGSPLHASIPSSLSNTIILATFMAGFCLIGIYGSAAKLILAVLRVPIEALALLMLKEGLADDNRAGEFLLGTVAVATATSLGIVPLGWFVPIATVGGSATIVAILFTLSTTIAAQIAVLFGLKLFSSPLSSTTTLFARNSILLFCGAFGEYGYPIRENWLQVLFVYAVGTAVVAWADPEVAAAVRGISSRSAGLSTAYSPLNANGNSNGSSGFAASPSVSNPNSPKLQPSTPTAAHRKSSNDRLSDSTASSFLSSCPLLALIPFIPLLIHLLQPPASNVPPLQHACSLLPNSLRTAICPLTALPLDLSSNTVDVVVSYYSEDLPAVKNHLNGIRNLEFVRNRVERFIIYNKGPFSEDEIRKGMDLKPNDEVVPIDNVGREGETYLKHIMLHYNNTASTTPFPVKALPPTLSQPLTHLRRRSLAAHTFFLQPHLAWDFIAAPRLQLVAADTGFAHFGPLIPGDCGKDEKVGVDFGLWTQMFSIFQGQLCAPGGQTMAWSAQFIVSRDRILANDYEKYAYVDELMSAPEGHWIHKMWGPNDSGGPSNPAFGHSVERAWPAIFNCWDPKIARECTDNVMDRNKCTCLDS
ncbi:uncharacterized protein JCM15063_003134 [Sporobolomyces koalae]|uniref:uncharacterized protein n=1 Tax=Sporobolomyces koalae TaxID=500713 RepID=UPI0031724EF0